MQHDTGTYQTGDGLELFTQHWLPEGEPRAAILLIHGLAEHCSRYAHVADYLAGRGYAVYSMDLRGHGQSEGLRGYVDSYQAYLQDLDGYFQQVRAEHPDWPFFVLGHSMGSLLAVTFVAQHQATLAGMITSGMLTSIGDAVPAILTRVVNTLSALAPKLPVMAVPAAEVSSDPAVKLAYDRDPLNYRGKVRARLGAELLGMGHDARRQAPQITIPSLLIHGGADRLCDPASTDEMWELLAAADKTRKVYAGMLHEVFNEIGKEQVLGDVADWLDAHS